MNNFFWDVREKLYRIFRHRFPFYFILQQENTNIKRLLNSIEIDRKKFVDLGTGNGNALQFFKQACGLLGVDITFSMLRRARHLHPDVLMIQADATSLPIQNSSVDIVTAIGLSEYIADFELFFGEVHRVLKNNGSFILTFSPPGIFVKIRSLLGNRLHPRKFQQIEQLGQQMDFDVIRTEQSFMQWQVLLKKK